MKRSTCRTTRWHRLPPNRVPEYPTILSRRALDATNPGKSGADFLWCEHDEIAATINLREYDASFDLHAVKAGKSRSTPSTSTPQWTPLWVEVEGATDIQIRKDELRVLVGYKNFRRKTVSPIMK
jgi:hypothetical protein